MNTYLVESPNGSQMKIEANSSTEAKRIFCKIRGYKINDPWCGKSCLSAKKIS